MKWLSRTVVLLIILAIGAILAGPIGPLPGVRIGGTETQPPTDWSTIDLPEEVQLRTTLTLWRTCQNRKMLSNLQVAASFFD